MRRIVRAHEVRSVASIAGCWRALVDVVDVACDAGQSCVHPEQSVSGVLQVVELRAKPAVHGVATLTRGRESKPLVVDHRRQEVLLMTGEAGGRQTLELPGCGILVAIVALRQCMRSYKWEAVLMVANRIQRDIPALDRVATLAIGAKLPAMDVGVTIGTFRADILENQTGMALGAADLLMHSPQGIASAIVVEFWIRANRLPTGIGVAILARSGQRAMRVGDLGLRTADIGVLVIHWFLCRHAQEQWKQGYADCHVPASPVHVPLQASLSCPSSRDSSRRRTCTEIKSNRVPKAMC